MFWFSWVRFLRGTRDRIKKRKGRISRNTYNYGVKIQKEINTRSCVGTFTEIKN